MEGKSATEIKEEITYKELTELQLKHHHEKRKHLYSFHNASSAPLQHSLQIHCKNFKGNLAIHMPVFLRQVGLVKYWLMNTLDTYLPALATTHCRDQNINSSKQY